MSLWSTLPPDEQVLAEPGRPRRSPRAGRGAGRARRPGRLPAGPAPGPDPPPGHRRAWAWPSSRVLWQLVAMLINDPVFLPSVSQTAASFAHYFGRPYPAQGKPLWYDALTSLRRILIGFTAGTVIGVALGAGMSASRVVRHAIDPVIEVLRPLPPLAFIPLFIIWLGIGEMPKEVLIMIGVIPIMAVTTVAALDEVPDDLRLCARTLGASPRYTMLRVQIRSALPGILTGMRISMAGAWTSIVAAELIAATSGLGYLIMQAGDYLNTALVFSGIIMIAILGLALDACLRGLLLLADPSRRR